ncbi:MAG TPA: hypothetical protein VFX98_07630 [Longimicrobiaceae bacterium]|nr:hypothetical protein [Longimicrobiaceae bacterium]
MRWTRRKLYRWGAVAAVVAVIFGIGAWRAMFRTVPVRWASIEEEFKYGSIGVEPNQGVPYWLWMVLPRVFPEHLPGPGGWAALGLTWEEGAELPVGFSKLTVGFPRVGINCALCHTATWRATPEGERHLVEAGNTSTVDVQAYQRFLVKCAKDPRFTADVLMPQITYVTRLSAADQALYRNVLIPQTRSALLALGEAAEWMDSRPDWGPGRVDPFNPVKFGMLGRPVDGTIGNSDMMAIWDLQQRQGKDLHWDGLQSSIHEVVLSSALGDGASRVSIPLDALDRVEDWLLEVPAPAHPFPVDRAKAARGGQVYGAAGCAGCHGRPGDWTARLVPVAAPGEPESNDRVATDDHRVKMWDQPSATTYNRYASGYDWKLSHFKDVNAYVAAPLSGVWLRSPYLHNGSVPTLWHLLRPEQRPAVFYRGYDVYDPVQVGFRWNVAGADDRRFFRYDTSLRGNSNRGHAYGAALSEADKDALVEYLKTL